MTNFKGKTPGWEFFKKAHRISPKKVNYLVVEPTHLKNMLVKLDHFPGVRGKNKKYLKPKPPPSKHLDMDIHRQIKPQIPSPFSVGLVVHIWVRYELTILTTETTHKTTNHPQLRQASQELRLPGYAG